MINLNYYKLFLINLSIKVTSIPMNINFPIKAENFDENSHLNFEHIKRICANNVAICKSNDTNICASRLHNDKMEYKDFENTCFLFINNMCVDYGKEFSIVSAGYCLEYFKHRRSYTTDNKNITSSTAKYFASNGKKATQRPLLRSETTLSTLYEVDTAFDFHTCPLSCPDVYSPVCVGVNRGHGLYYKFFTFVNHCEGDLYYCKHWREFSPPPDEEEMVKSSPLSWSYCAANRYIQFARFTEMTSSMGHYGWLAGDYKPTHIIEPHERMPGYG